MNVRLTAAEWEQLQALQKQRRHAVGYVNVNVNVTGRRQRRRLDKPRPLAGIAADLGLDHATACHYAGACAGPGPAQHLAHEQPGYRDTSARLAHLCREVNTTFCRTKGRFRTAVPDFFNRLSEFGQDLAASLTRKFHILDAQPSSQRI